MKNIIIRVFLIFVLFTGLMFLGINYTVNRSTKSQLYDDVNLIPKNKVGLLLGTAKFDLKGKLLVDSKYYENRIEAAVVLYMAGKIDFIIVSGDNSTKYYNEPETMKNDLVARGVPANRIILDGEGVRTWDSILRCRDIFGQRRFTIISQEFHNKRAVFIANHKNVTVVAYNAPDRDKWVRVAIREQFARVKMMFDILMNKQANFYGEKVDIN